MSDYHVQKLYYYLLTSMVLDGTLEDSSHNWEGKRKMENSEGLEREIGKKEPTSFTGYFNENYREDIFPGDENTFSIGIRDSSTSITARLKSFYLKEIRKNELKRHP